MGITTHFRNGSRAGSLTAPIVVAMPGVRMIVVKIPVLVLQATMIPTMLRSAVEPLLMSACVVSVNVPVYLPVLHMIACMSIVI